MEELLSPYQCFDINDVWQIQSVFEEANTNYLQWSSGNLSAMRQQLDLGDISIIRNDCNRGLLVELQQPSDCLTLCFFQQTSSSINWQGDELKQHEVMVLRPGSDAKYRLPEKWWNIEIDIYEPLFSILGLTDTNNDQPFEQTKGIIIEPHQQSRLVYFIINKLTAITNNPLLIHSQSWMAETRLQLMIFLQQALYAYQASTLNKPNSQQQLGMQITEQISRHVEQNIPLNIEHLAHNLSTHERQIYRTISQQKGLTPYAYYQLMRLHKFRQALLDSNGSHGVITHYASNTGISNISRLTAQFCQHFGETPRQYLRDTHK